MAYPLKKVVEVEWVDSNGRSRWADISEYREHVIANCKTAGYILQQDKHQVTICLSQCDNADIMQALSIPRGCIKKVRTLK